MYKLGMMKLVPFICLVFYSQYGNSAKILAVFDAASPSHYYLGNAYLRALAEAGHDVTMVSPFEEKNPPKNGTYRDVVLTGAYEELQKIMSSMSMNSWIFKSPYLMMTFATMMSNKIEQTIKHPNFQALINSDAKFDVVIVEQFFNDALKVLGQHYNAPLILFSTQGSNYIINGLAANEAPRSYVPETLLGYSSDMSLYQRLQNTVFSFYATIIQNFIVYPSQAKIAHKYFPQTNFYDALYNQSLIFLNTHESISSAVPSVPSMINVGGFHIKDPKPLPKDLKDFFDNATHGVIYFSMGSNLKSANLPEEKRNAIMNTFAKLKQKVLWKFEDDKIENLPANVKISKWLPQQSVLAHPNLKIFITHGGLLSTIETVYFGVPIIGIPIFADQKLNSRSAEVNEYGRVVHFDDISEEKLTETIQDILTDPKYSKNAKIRSKIMRDRERKPIDTAVYWTEYVIRHRGAPHLRVAGLDLPWYKYYLLDVYLTLLVILWLSIYLPFILIRWFICRRNKNKTAKVKTN